MRAMDFIGAGAQNYKGDYKFIFYSIIDLIYIYIFLKVVKGCIESKRIAKQ